MEDNILDRKNFLFSGEFEMPTTFEINERQGFIDAQLEKRKWEETEDWLRVEGCLDGGLFLKL